jgi:hypothetical protein
MPLPRLAFPALVVLGSAALAAPRVDSPHPPGDLFFGKYCLDFSDPKAARLWTDVFDQLSAGQMPPKKKEQPAARSTAEVLVWLKTGLTKADLDRRNAEGRVVLRRLNRTEYENTIRDLLDTYVEVKDLLPEDASSMGFDNIGDALNVSSVLMERYLEAADAALDAAIVTKPRPETKTWNVMMGPETKNPNDYRLRVGARWLPDETFVYFNSGDVPIVCDRFKAPVPGRYRIRLTCYAYGSDKPLAMSVIAGSFDPKAPKTRTVGYFDVRPEEARVIEWVEQLPLRGTFKVLAHGIGRRDLSKNVEQYEGPGVAVARVEAEGPLLDSWPPAGHRRLFGELDLQKATLADAETVLRNFAPRAFRRPVQDGEIAPFLALVKAKLDAGQAFEAAIRVGLKAILCAPDFLFLVEGRERPRTASLGSKTPALLGPHEVASRLSYFLWSTMPDETLLALAAQGTLTQPAVLRAQVERMLNDPRARAFTENFTGQWLLLRQIDFTTPDKKLYPEHDVTLQDSLVQETHLFFEDLLRNDLSLLNFIHSDFSFLNERLARHYGLWREDGRIFWSDPVLEAAARSGQPKPKGTAAAPEPQPVSARRPLVEGQEFQKVQLPPESHRGGVLTQASVLKVTANGTNTSPVVRGAWVMRNILGQPPKPPPPNVPAVEPDIRGAKSIREQLAKHRSIETCNSCHVSMDPPGIALESFDPIGGWREQYRFVGEARGKQVRLDLDGRRADIKLGLPVDAGDVLPDGRTFAGIDEFKQRLLEDKDQVARCLAEKLLVYGTGGALGFADREALDGIVSRIKTKDYGFRTLVHEVVQSPTFLRK